jgi:hypothetical protein
MEVISLLPPTLMVKSIDGANGRNWPFLALVERGHPFAAAIAAQEVREARLTARACLPGLLLGVAGTAVALAVGLVPAIPSALAFCALMTLCSTFASGNVLADDQDIELCGQAVECVVRRDEYATPLAQSIDDAAAQISHYPQFKGRRTWTTQRLRDELTSRVSDAEHWARKNEKLIVRAFRASR